MAVGIKNLKNAVDDRLLVGGLSSLAQCQLDNAQAILNGQALVRVADSLSSLPLAGDNEGALIYVNDINEYRFSNGAEWLDDFSSTVSTYREFWSWGTNDVGQFANGEISNNPVCIPEKNSQNGASWCVLRTNCEHSAGIKTDGTLWSWGNALSLGLGAYKMSSLTPAREFCSASNWCDVSAGSAQTLAIKTDGTLWAWGNNGNGQLGIGTTINVTSPVREISASSNWCAVSSGGFHGNAIKSDGTLWSWGRASCGRLADGTTVDKCSPVREVSLSTNWCAVNASAFHTVALKTDGTIWSWGWAACGRIGDGTTVDKCSPVREATLSSNWSKISTGEFNTFALKTDGTLWAWGCNALGRLADGTTVDKCSPVREISSSTDWCFVGNAGRGGAAIKTDSSLWAWGSGANGLVGDGALSSKCSPVREITSSNDWCFVEVGCRAALAIKLKTRGFL